MPFPAIMSLLVFLQILFPPTLSQRLAQRLLEISGREKLQTDLVIFKQKLFFSFCLVIRRYSLLRYSFKSNEQWGFKYWTPEYLNHLNTRLLCPIFNGRTIQIPTVQVVNFYTFEYRVGLKTECSTNSFGPFFPVFKSLLFRV